MDRRIPKTWAVFRCQVSVYTACKLQITATVKELLGMYLIWSILQQRRKNITWIRFTFQRSFSIILICIQSCQSYCVSVTSEIPYREQTRVWLKTGFLSFLVWQLICFGSGYQSSNLESRPIAGCFNISLVVLKNPSVQIKIKMRFVFSNFLSCHCFLLYKSTLKKLRKYYYKRGLRNIEHSFYDRCNRKVKDSYWFSVLLRLKF